MPAGIEKTDHAVFAGNEPAWHGLGTVLEQEALTAKEAIEAARLDWDVIQRPLLYTTDPMIGQHQTLDGWFVNVREDTGSVLGVVKDQYEVIQNREVFAVVDAVLGGPDVRWDTAGSLYSGKKVWALAKLDRDILIGGDKDERIDPYVCAATSHDGSLALTVFTTPIRVVCQNTLTWALGRSRRSVKIKHAPNMMAKVAQITDVLGVANAYYDQMKLVGDHLIGQRLDPLQRARWIDELLPRPSEDAMAEKADGGKRLMTYWEGRRDRLWDAINAPDLANVKETKWGWVQAVAGYVDHQKSYRSADRRMDAVFFGEAIDKQKALEQALR